MLTQAQEKSVSKLMTLILRHDPVSFGIVLDPEDGSCPIDELLRAVQAQPRWSGIKQEDVEQVVRNSDKQRFELIQDRIRARYGHSFSKIQYKAAEPPALLYHGTNKGALAAIWKKGLLPMGRQYVHLSEGTHFATLAGSRRGELVILEVNTDGAKESGVSFYYAGNEVWLADRIPPECCTVTDAGQKGGDRS
ncbi:RNA 2'-phosphotransferase [Gorillibacterium sp. CAU 1737]|uniref:RNA 2'-phosphotransferase n=1 Tax=Gorillibacterium sp. CAU 1737 TaxID=3140362 RepID=UPI00325FEAC3